MNIPRNTEMTMSACSDNGATKMSHIDRITSAKIYPISSECTIMALQ